VMFQNCIAPGRLPWFSSGAIRFR